MDFQIPFSAEALKLQGQLLASLVARRLERALTGFPHAQSLVELRAAADGARQLAELLEQALDAFPIAAAEQACFPELCRAPEVGEEVTEHRHELLAAVAAARLQAYASGKVAYLRPRRSNAAAEGGAA